MCRCDKKRDNNIKITINDSSLINDVIDSRQGQSHVNEKIKSESDSVCCDFHWELTKVSSNSIHLASKSIFFPKHHPNISLQISCPHTKPEPWFLVLQNLVSSNSEFHENQLSSSSNRSQEINHVQPSPESPKPQLPPKKVRSASGDTTRSSENSKLVKGSVVQSYNLYGDSNIAKDTIKAYIDADKLIQEQRVFR